MGLSVLDFFIMLAVVTMVAYFATKGKRRRLPQMEDSPLLMGKRININRSPLLRIPLAEATDKPYFLCFDTETADIIKDDAREGQGELPPAVALSYNLLSRQGHLILSESFLLKRDCKISAEARAINRIDEEAITTKGSDPNSVYDAFRLALEKASVVVAHNLPVHQCIIDQDRSRLDLPPINWSTKKAFCTMAKGEEYLRSSDPYYYGASPALRLLYGKLYYNRYDMQFTDDNKSLADLLLISACLAYLYPSE